MAMRYHSHPENMTEVHKAERNAYLASRFEHSTVGLNPAPEFYRASVRNRFREFMEVEAPIVSVAPLLESTREEQQLTHRERVAQVLAEKARLAREATEPTRAARAR